MAVATFIWAHYMGFTTVLSNGPAVGPIAFALSALFVCTAARKQIVGQTITSMDHVFKLFLVLNTTMWFEGNNF